MMDSGIISPVEAVLEQFLELASLAFLGRVVRPQQQATLPEIAVWMHEVASHTPSVRNVQPETQTLLKNFFSFLRREDLLTKLSSHDFGCEPATATDERRAGPFWQLAALIHDLWEHCCDPAVGARDLAVLGFIDYIKPRQIYDLGSGACFFAFEAAANGSAVRCAETNATKRRFTRYLHEACRLPISTSGAHSGFDLVLAIDVLDHMERPAQAIFGAFRRLRDGGLLLLQAEFKADGWHTGGDYVIEEVFAALHRYFIPLSSAALDAQRTLLFRRRQVPVLDAMSIATHAPIRKSAALKIMPYKLADSYVVTSNSFVVRPTLLTDLGTKLLAECTNGVSVGELKDRMLIRYGLNGELVEDVLVELRASRVLAIDGDLCMERSYVQ